MKKQNDLFLFILAGGSGERFWPLSRTKTPKHLLSLFSKKTLLEETLLRVKNLVPPSQLFILTNIQQKKLIHQKLPWFPAKQIITEPEKRDTAPAATLATAIAYQKNSKAVVALLPADHLIKKNNLFQKNLLLAKKIAEQENTLVTFGIHPTFPSTGFGYLKINSQSPRKSVPYPVAKFLEKPDLKTATRFVKQKNYYWNAGIFLWRADYFLQETQHHAPDLGQFIKNFPSNNPFPYIKTQFPKLKKISLDYAIAEKAKNVKAIIAAFDWDDVGSWEALVNYFSADKNNNILLGKGIISDSSSNIIVNKTHQIIALQGVQDLILITTKDAILVLHRCHTQNIKKLFARLPHHFR